MAQDVLHNCKKYVIQRIINPSVYWVTEYEKEIFKTHIKQLQLLLAGSVEKIKDETVPFGSMVAIKNSTKNVFYRGIITDAFYRKNEMTYCILLVDYGKVFETSKENVYFIKSKELRNRQFSAFEVTIQGIQPVVLDIDYEKKFGSSIFKKRACNKWPRTAVEFVRGLLKKNPHVYVKEICRNKWKISGDIYFTDKTQKEIVSLGQLLCDKGFSIFCSVKTGQKRDLKGEGSICIEEKIPKKALLKDRHKSVETEDLKEVQKDRNERKEVSLSESMQKRCKVQGGASSFSSTLTSGNNDTASPKAICYSSSWMLKKCLLQTTLSPSSANNSSVAR